MGGRDDTESKVFWECFLVLRAWVAGQAKLKYVSPFHFAPDEPRAAGREKRESSRQPRSGWSAGSAVAIHFPLYPFFSLCAVSQSGAVRTTLLNESASL